jgi:hypothetical protein
MLRWILTSLFALLAGVSLVFPLPYYLLVYRPLRQEHEPRHAQWQEKQKAWIAEMNKQAELRKGSAVKMLGSGRDGDRAIWGIGELSSRLAWYTLRDEADDFYEEQIRPNQRPYGRARTSSTIQAGASVILVCLCLMAGLVVLWRGGILKGLLVGFLFGLLIGGSLSSLWGWLLLPLSPIDYLIFVAILAAGGLFAGGFIGLVNRVLMWLTTPKQQVDASAREEKNS